LGGALEANDGCYSCRSLLRGDMDARERERERERERDIEREREREGGRGAAR
jgi:hypothetical protein